MNRQPTPIETLYIVQRRQYAQYGPFLHFEVWSLVPHASYLLRESAGIWDLEWSGYEREPTVEGMAFILTIQVTFDDNEGNKRYQSVSDE